jgi:hypothetical protein
MIRKLSTILLIPLLIAFLFWQTAQVPEIAKPCHGWMSGDKQRMVISWQIGHPIEAGVLSALSLGLWPLSGFYAVPSTCTAQSYGTGYPMHWYSALAHDAFPAYRASRAVSAFLLSALGLGLLLRWRSSWQPPLCRVARYWAGRMHHKNPSSDPS